MHTFIIRIELEGQNPKTLVENVKTLFEEALASKHDKGGQDEEIKSSMMEKLPDFVGNNFIMWVDPGGKQDRSYWLNIYIPGRANILMSAAFYSLNTLQDITTYEVAKNIRDKEDVRRLEIPEALKPKLKMICRQLNK